MIIPLNPASFAVLAHCLQSRSVGLNMSSGSVPSPHSLPLKVLGPKWTNMLRSIICHLTWAGEGMAPYGSGPLPHEQMRAAAKANEMMYLFFSIWVCYNVIVSSSLMSFEDAPTMRVKSPFSTILFIEASYIRKASLPRSNSTFKV